MREKMCDCCEEMVPKKELKKVKKAMERGKIQMCENCRDPNNWDYGNWDHLLYDNEV